MEKITKETRDITEVCDQCGSFNSKERAISGVDMYRGESHEGIANRQVCEDCGSIWLTDKQKRELHEWINIIRKNKQEKEEAKNKKKISHLVRRFLNIGYDEKIRDLIIEGYSLELVAYKLNSDKLTIAQFCREYYEKSFGDYKRELQKNYKTCEICKEILPLKMFSPSDVSKGRYIANCKRCQCARKGKVYKDDDDVREDEKDAGNWLNGDGYLFL